MRIFLKMFFVWLRSIGSLTPPPEISQELLQEIREIRYGAFCTQAREGSFSEQGVS